MSGLLRNTLSAGAGVGRGALGWWTKIIVFVEDTGGVRVQSVIKIHTRSLPNERPFPPP
jgi:hypothetical protein